MTLSTETCAPCREGSPALPEAEARALHRDVPGWTLEAKALSREFLMKDFSAGARLIEAVAREADAQDHHPDLHLEGYRRLTFVLSTHSIGGLSRNDFIMAARIDALPKELKT
ncbi:MAG: 4a-hydroxytetrahydrobiopterin dehydratase [Proteobacteria bacterium]|nr:4a-hydroxytetrahydrobiopterin dehydratase [Pseudomonadota bacterium]